VSIASFVSMAGLVNGIAQALSTGMCIRVGSLLGTLKRKAFCCCLDVPNVSQVNVLVPKDW
jgi:hypothetical protein